MGTSSNFSLGWALLKFLFTFIMFIFMVVFAYYGTRFIGKNYKSLNKNKHIEVIDYINLQGLKIYLIKLKDQVYFLAMSSNSIELLDKLSLEDVGPLGDLKDPEIFEYIIKKINIKKRRCKEDKQNE